MRALDWLAEKLQRALAPRRQKRVRNIGQMKMRPRLESLEPISLLSTMSSMVSLPSTVTAATTTETQTQTIAVTSGQTNLTNEPFAPPLDLFDTALGTLDSVTISSSVNFSSNFSFMNFSTSSPATVTQAQVDGTYTVTGLPGATLSGAATGTLPPGVNPVVPAATAPGVPSTISVPVQAADSKTQTITDPTTLAQYEAMTPGETITPSLTSSAPTTTATTNGNVTSTVATQTTATETIVYTFTPPATPMCQVSGLVRFGVHHQQTQLVVSFTGTVDPTLANNPANYSIVASNGARIPVVSATFDPASNTVTLIPARRLNAHYHFVLDLTLPCAGGTQVSVPFGGKASLGGFTGEHHQHFFKLVGGRRLVEVS